MLDVTTPTVVTMEHATLYLGDADELLHRLGRVLLVADPPYLFDNSGGGAFRAARGASDQIVAERLDEGFDHSIINPLLHPSVVVFCHNDQLPELLAYLAGNYRRVCVNVWIKPNPSPHRNKPRAGWNGKDMWIALSGPLEGRTIAFENFWSKPCSEFARYNGGSATVLPCINMKTADGKILMGWLASQTDMLADDWVIIP